MTERRINREIAKRILTKGKLQTVVMADFAALLSGLLQSIKDKDVGFNHATTDVDGWLNGLAPNGLTMDVAFIEDMLYACNMLDELDKFEHPQGKTFDGMLRTVLMPGQSFDKETNSIEDKK